MTTYGDYLTADELAAYLDTDPKHVRALQAKGWGPPVSYPNGEPRWLRADVDRWYASIADEPAPGAR